MKSYYFEDTLDHLGFTYGVEFTYKVRLPKSIVSIKAIWHDGHNIIKCCNSVMIREAENKARKWFIRMLEDAEQARYEIRYNL